MWNELQLQGRCNLKEQWMKMLRITSQAAALQLGIAGSVAHAQAAPGNPASCPTGSIPTNESSITIRQSRNGSVSTHHRSNPAI
jgi:hypothetical protein